VLAWRGLAWGKWVLSVVGYRCGACAVCTVRLYARPPSPRSRPLTLETLPFLTSLAGWQPTSLP